MTTLLQCICQNLKAMLISKYGIRVKILSSMLYAIFSIVFNRYLIFQYYAIFSTIYITYQNYTSFLTTIDQKCISGVQNSKIVYGASSYFGYFNFQTQTHSLYFLFKKNKFLNDMSSHNPKRQLTISNGIVNLCRVFKSQITLSGFSFLLGVISLCRFSFPLKP